MKFKRIPLIALIFGVAVVGLGAAEQKRSLSDNAALRYYAAFTVMQDAVISDAEARKLIGLEEHPLVLFDRLHRVGGVVLAADGEDQH